MHLLKLYSVGDFEHLERPDKFRGSTLQSSALEVLTDFNSSKAYVVESNTKIHEIETMMSKAHVRLKFVIDKDERFLGLVTVSDLARENLKKFLDAGLDISNITATDIMTPKSQLMAFDYEELKQSTIGDILTSLQLTNVHHCLVIDNSSHMIRGLISASDVARNLDFKVPYDQTSSFLELYDILVEKMSLEARASGS